MPTTVSNPLRTRFSQLDHFYPMTSQFGTEKLYVGVDVGGTKIQASLITESGSVLANNRRATPRDGGPELTLETVEEAIVELLERKGLKIEDMEAVGIAVPGVVRQETGFVVVTPNMNLSGIELGPAMKDRLRLPVAIGNDCNLGTLGECWLGSGRNANSCVGIFVGTGIGAGIVKDFEVQSGAGQAAGEIGHIVSQLPCETWRHVLKLDQPVAMSRGLKNVMKSADCFIKQTAKKNGDKEEKRKDDKKIDPTAVKMKNNCTENIDVPPELVRCGCGNYGCFETFASRSAIERFIRQAIAEGAHSIIKELNGGKLDVIKSGSLAKALKAEDRVVSAVVHYAAQVIGYACLTVRHLLDPEVIILGGGVMEACHKYMMPVIEAIISNDKLPSAPGNRRLLVSSLGDNAVVLGAVALARSLDGHGSLQHIRRIVPKYPTLRMMAENVIHIADTPYSADFMISSDGEIQPRKKNKKVDKKNRDGFRLKDLETASAGGTDLMILATPAAGEVALSGKCHDYLYHRGIDYRILSLDEAVQVYNSSALRRSVVFHFPAAEY